MTIIASMWTSASPAPFRTARALACIAVAACLVAADSPPLTGMWGGADALLAIDAQGGRLQTGCTLVRFAAVSPDADGRFQTSAHAATLQLAPPVTDGEDDKALPDPAEMPATRTDSREVRRADRGIRRSRLMPRRE